MCGQVVFSAPLPAMMPMWPPWTRNSSLSVLDASDAKAGAYSVTLGNSLGTTNSDPAVLTVLSLPEGTYAASVLNAMPLIYYRFSEAAETNVAFNLGGLGVSHNGLYEGTYSGADGPRPPDFANFESTNAAVFLDRNGFGVSSADVQIPALNLDTTAGAHCTLAAWINSAAPQASFSGIIFNRGVSGANGLGVKQNALGDILEYHWNNTYFAFDSGLIVPVGQWVFVALVIEPAKGTLYLYNGATVQTTLGAGVRYVHTARVPVAALGAVAALPGVTYVGASVPLHPTLDVSTGAAHSHPGCPRRANPTHTTAANRTIPNIWGRSAAPPAHTAKPARASQAARLVAAPAARHARNTNRDVAPTSPARNRARPAHPPARWTRANTTWAPHC